MIRIRLLTMNDVYKYRSVSHAFYRIIKDEKFRGLYRGACPYFINLIGTYSLNLTIYELLIDAYMKHYGLINFKKHETLHVIEASVLTAITCVILTNSLEVIVVRR